VVQQYRNVVALMYINTHEATLSFSHLRSKLRGIKP
jgi:hypothetical protein